jgi:hypothetical protein
MPARQPSRIAYVDRESLTEELVPDPSEDAVTRERLEQENAELRDQVKHLQSDPSDTIQTAKKFERHNKFQRRKGATGGVFMKTVYGGAKVHPSS